MGIRPEPRDAGVRRSRAALYLALFFFSAVAACTDILGITDKTLTSSGTGTGASGGTGGTGGIAGSGGTGGAAPCAADADCLGSPFGDKCDTETGACVECLPGPDDTCAYGLYCDASKLCFIGCADDADCNPNGQTGPLKCDTTSHQCTECGSGGICPPGTKCDTDSEVCVPGCDLSTDCPTTDWQCCSGQCRNITKDLQNCGACDDPCKPDQSTTWLCLDGGCVFQSCNAGYADCDQNLAEGNGCEVSTQTDAANCGGCDDPCNLANAGAVCDEGSCEIGSCNAPFQNCDGLPANGCEKNLDTDAANCGDCNQSCEGVFTNAVPACQNGQCAFGGCKSGFGDCNGNQVDGCEVVLSNNIQHCGACDAPCILPNAAPACVGGMCEVDMCNDGFGDCTAAPGCETNINSSATHCGMCGNSCDMFPNANGVCNGGDCQLGACKAGFADCDGVPDNGCETDTTTTMNCGGCGKVCGSAGTSAVTCNGGSCQITCDSTHGNCDGLASNGCEINITNNVGHCGMCGNVCPANGGVPNCVNKVCGSSNCGANLADCDGNGSCETGINTPDNCGGCGNQCSTNHASQVACTGNPLACLPTCESGWGNCNNNPSDGCEQQLNTNQHCTACGTICQAPNANTSCASGSCQIVSCALGWADCNGLAADGCEAQLATSVQHCGACNQPCDPANANGQCVNSVCSIQSCDSGYLDCNSSPNDGCEIDKTDDPLNCGSCGNTCSFPNAQAECVFPGTCQIGQCNSNFNNCDGMNANGCEANTQTSTQHCGFCNNACASINGAASCSFGSCSINCNGGYENCNGAYNDGCETSLHTLQDCGGCGVPCDLPNANESCTTGVCQLVSCQASFANCDQFAANGCECGPNAACLAGMCQGCGDLFCNPAIGETCLSCAIDCCIDPCDNDSICETGESCPSCLDCCGMGGAGGTGAGGMGGTGASGMGGSFTSSSSSGMGGTGASGMGGSFTSSSSSSGFGGAGGSGASGMGGSFTSSSSGFGGAGGGSCAPPSPMPPPFSVACQTNPGLFPVPQCAMGLGCCEPGTTPTPNCLVQGACGGVFYPCDDVSDCAGDRCCTLGPGNSGSVCASSCAGNQEELCTAPTAGAWACECSGYQQCCPSKPGGKSSYYPTCQPVGQACQ